MVYLWSEEKHISGKNYPDCFCISCKTDYSSKVLDKYFYEAEKYLDKKFNRLTVQKV